MNTLVAKRDVIGFCLSDAEGYELIIDLKAGSRIKVWNVLDVYEDEIIVNMFGPDDEYIVSTEDFDIER